MARLTAWTIAGSLLLAAAGCDKKKSNGSNAVEVASFPSGDGSIGDGFDAGAGGAGGRGGTGGPGFSGVSGASGASAGGAALRGSSSGFGASASGGGLGGGGAPAANGGGGSKSGGSGAAIGYVAMPFTETVECQMCQKRWPVCVARRDACLTATAMAAAGPKAGTRENELCRDTLACLYNSKCADLKADKLACLCGVGVSLDQCVMSGAVGMCAGELEASAETIVPLDISTRLADPRYAAGLAFRELQCAERYCSKSCGLCPTSNPMCIDAELGMEPAP